MKFAVLGNSGSGKSTLARWLAAAIDAPVLDLDTIVWEPRKIAALRAEEAALKDIADFCDGRDCWVVEGCYANMIEATLRYAPTLVFLKPPLEQCVENCRSRPWEPHKYASKAEQDERLAFLLDWVAEYYSRDGVMSLRGHQAAFDRYSGPKFEISERLSFDPASPALAEIAGPQSPRITNPKSRIPSV
jgi:adenylate kinase family enzyme